MSVSVYWVDVQCVFIVHQCRGIGGIHYTFVRSLTKASLIEKSVFYMLFKTHVQAIPQTVNKEKRKRADKEQYLAARQRLKALLKGSDFPRR